LLGWFAAAWLLNPMAWAEPASPDPLDARVAVPAVLYTSPLARYQPLAEASAQPWREANERVGRIGGWRAYAREAAQPAQGAQTETPATPAAAAPSVKPPADAARPASGHGHRHAPRQGQGQAETAPPPPRQGQGQGQVHKH